MDSNDGQATFLGWQYCCLIPGDVLLNSFINLSASPLPQSCSGVTRRWWNSSFLANCSNSFELNGILLSLLAASASPSLVGMRNGAVMEKYLGMNFDKYPIMLKKLVTTSSDSGRLDSLTAFIFVWVWPQPIFSELLCIKLNLFNSELALVRVRSSAKIWYSLYDSFQGLVVLLKVSPT